MSTPSSAGRQWARGRRVYDGSVIVDTLTVVSQGKSDDDETGYVVLEGREGLEYYQRDELIAEEAIRCSRGVHEEPGTGPIKASINPAARLTSEDARGLRARVEYQSRMVEALQDILGPPAPLMPQRSVFLDYIPWVGYMVAVDDMLERRAWDGRGSGRWTRNSMRTVHARSIDVGEGQREVLRGSRLGAVAGSTGSARS